MHEMSLAISVVEEVERVLAGFGPRARAVTVTLQVGGLRAVVPEAMEFCFEAASQGTRVQGARLAIERVPIVVRCDRCRCQWTVEAVAFLCPTCEGPVRVLTGKELLLRSIEIDDGEDPPPPPPETGG
ncbi:MAG: hydrogenase maturation nickel metallochaperone HypA [Thermoleophilia bacterium]